MLATVAISLAVVVAGAIATYLYDPDSPPLARVSTGACTGLAAFALVGYLAAWLTERSTTSLLPAVAAALVVVLFPLALLRRTAVREALLADMRRVGRDSRGFLSRPTLAAVARVVYWGAMAVGLWFVFDRVLFERPDGLYTGYVNNLGDLPFHLQVSASFAYGGNVPTEDPIYLGSTFSYPYMADFLTAMFVAVGATFRDAFLVPNLVLAVSLVGVMQRWTRDLTRDRLAAAIAPLLLLLSGGLGWVLLLQDARAGENGLIGALTSMTHDFTIQGDSIFRFGNAITALLVPQRSFLFGLPIAVVVFTLLWAELQEDREDQPAEAVSRGRPGPQGLAARVIRAVIAERRMLAAGLITGTLVLVHAYLFVVVMGTAGAFGLIFRQWRRGLWQRWAVFLVAAALVALPEVVWSTVGSQASAGSFIGFELGWDHPAGADPVTFWVANTGLLIPLLVLAFGWERRSSQRDDAGEIAAEPIVSGRLLRYYLPFVLWFAIPNVLRLAPWIWDNIKVLFVWYTASVPIVAVLLASMLRSRALVQVVGIVLLASLTLAGGLDIFRAASGATAYREYDRDGIALAGAVLRSTAPRAVVLHAPTYNPPPYLTGRRSVMGYPGNVWSSGLPYVDRQRDIETMYAGSPEAEDLLRRYRITYVEISPLERAMMPVNDAFFSHFRLVAQVGDYRLYAVP